MHLTADNLRDLVAVAEVAAKQAGDLIETYSNKTIQVQHKIAGDSVASQVLTEVDLKSEAIIVKALKPTCEKYDLALLTEETEDDLSRLTKDYFWCVDPMDGTLAFTESVAGYSVSIALVSKSGEPIIGVVYDPVEHNLYSAVKLQGVFKNGQVWAPLPESGKYNPLTLVCDRGFLAKEYYSKVCEKLESMATDQGFSALSVIEQNGAVLNACHVLDTPPAIYFKLPKPEQGGGSLWDFSATAAIFHELGYVATDFYGAPLELNRADSTYMNHRGVIFCLDKVLAEKIQTLIAVV